MKYTYIVVVEVYVVRVGLLCHPILARNLIQLQMHVDDPFPFWLWIIHTFFVPHLHKRTHLSEFTTVVGYLKIHTRGILEALRTFYVW